MCAGGMTWRLRAFHPCTRLTTSSTDDASAGLEATQWSVARSSIPEGFS
jgi:hypothetical protein